MWMLNDKLPSVWWKAVVFDRDADPEQAALAASVFGCRFTSEVLRTACIDRSGRVAVGLQVLAV